MKLFLGSLALTMGNPKTMVFFLAVLPTVVELKRLTVGGFFEIALVASCVLPTGSRVLCLSSPAAPGSTSPARNRCAGCSGGLARSWRGPPWRSLPGDARLTAHNIRPPWPVYLSRWTPRSMLF